MAQSVEKAKLVAEQLKQLDKNTVKFSAIMNLIEAKNHCT